MLETTRTSLYNKTALLRWRNLPVLAWLALVGPLHASTVWAEPFENHEIARALITTPIVPAEAQDLANSFIEHTLPLLLADDTRLAHQLGFGDGMKGTVVLEKAFPLFRISREDVVKYILRKGLVDPLVVVNNTNNWLKDQSGNLVAKRLILPIKIHDAPSWFSLTIEQSSSGAWRIIQVGAPKLSQAMKTFERMNQFLLWIPDLNRHYLGRIEVTAPRRAAIFLTVLFTDLLTHRTPGDEFEATSPDFIRQLRQLYEDLDFPIKSTRKGYDRAKMPSEVR